MATVPYTAFLPEVLPKVPACADIVAVNAVRNAAIDFCTRTLVWSEKQDTVTVTPLDFPYDLDAPNGARACGVMSAKFNGIRIDPTTQDELDTQGTSWESDTGAPRFFFQPTPYTFQTYPIPDGDGTLDLRVAFCPKRDSSLIEEFIYQLYIEGVAAGALARLMREPNQPYSNPGLADYYDSQFEKEVTKAKIEANKSLTRGAPTVQMRSLA